MSFLLCLCGLSHTFDKEGIRVNCTHFVSTPSIRIHSEEDYVRQSYFDAHFREDKRSSSKLTATSQHFNSRTSVTATMVRVQSSGHKENYARNFPRLSQKHIAVVGGLAAAVALIVVHLCFSSSADLGSRALRMRQWRTETMRSSNHITKETDSKRDPIVLTYQKPKKKFSISNFTQREFIVNGVNLAQYSFEDGKEGSDQTIHLTKYYELFEDFSIKEQIGHRHFLWEELNQFRHDLERDSLSFYGDKVASKRMYEARGIPQVEHVVRYTHELKGKNTKATCEEILKLIPKHKSYVAKSSHLCSSYGVHVVKYNTKTKKHSFLFSRKVGRGVVARENFAYNETEVAEAILENLQSKNHKRESYAIRQVKPGLVIEERFTALGGRDQVPAVEFNVFTVWGRVLFVHYKTGNNVRLGVFDRDGKVIDYQGTEIPDWVDWPKVIALAETMGAQKDYLRVDIFAGIPADSPALELDPNDANARAQQREAVQIVVNEVAFHSTLLIPTIAKNELHRLWLAGYKMGIYKYVPNSEVPPAYVQKGYLSEEDLAEWIHSNGGKMRVKL